MFLHLSVLVLIHFVQLRLILLYERVLKLPERLLGGLICRRPILDNTRTVSQGLRAYRQRAAPEPTFFRRYNRMLRSTAVTSLGSSGKWRRGKSLYNSLLSSSGRDTKMTAMNIREKKSDVLFNLSFFSNSSLRISCARSSCTERLTPPVSSFLSLLQ